MVSLFTFIIDILTWDETFCSATEVIGGEVTKLDDGARLTDTLGWIGFVPVEKYVGDGGSVSAVGPKWGETIHWLKILCTEILTSKQTLFSCNECDYLRAACSICTLTWCTVTITHATVLLALIYYPFSYLPLLLCFASGFFMCNQLVNDVLRSFLNSVWKAIIQVIQGVGESFSFPRRSPPAS